MRSKEVFRYLLIVSWCMVAIAGSAMSTSFADAVKNTSAALKEGNAKKLSALFSNTVNLSIKREEGSYTKFQAELLLQEFFRSTKVNGLKVVQQANSSTTSFIVFTLTSNSKNYRVFVKFIQANNKEFKIDEVRIE